MDNPSAKEFWKALRKELKITQACLFFLFVVNAWNVPGPPWSTWPQITPRPTEFCRECGKTALLHSCLMFSGFVLPPSDPHPSLAPNDLLEAGEGLSSSILSDQTVTVG